MHKRRQAHVHFTQLL